MNNLLVSLPSKGRIRPRISVGKLAEYLEAPPARRRRILKDQKYPPQFQTTWYNDCFDTAVAFCADPDHRSDFLKQAIADLTKKPALNENQLIVRANNIEALQHLTNCRAKLFVPGSIFSKLHENSGYILVGEVNVSVRPELQLLVESEGCIRSGLLKLYINKTHALTEETGKYAASVVHQYGCSRKRTGQDVETKYCYVLDVFRERLHMAPRHFKQRWIQIEAACHEIASQWPSL
jgi:hypothetical protein